jgi:dTDP-4-dehydrorhamnose reductase
LHPELRPTNEREYRTRARRPKYSALSNAKMERAGIPPMPSMPEAVASYMIERETYVTAVR